MIPKTKTTCLLPQPQTNYQEVSGFLVDSQIEIDGTLINIDKQTIEIRNS